MNHQEAFDKNWQHFVVEKSKPAIASLSHACAYIMEDDDRRCGIGILLTEDEARALAASNPSVGLIFGGYKGGVPESLKGMDPRFLENLQSCHDTAARVWGDEFHAIFRDKMRGLALVHNLEVPS